MTNFTNYQAKAFDTQNSNIWVVCIPYYSPFSSHPHSQFLILLLPDFPSSRLPVFPIFGLSDFPVFLPISTLPYIPAVPFPLQTRG